MKIIETHLSFSSLSYRSSTKRIILHNADASTCTPKQIHQWHKANGWSGAGYHFLVRKNGKIYRLRPEGAIGAHAQGANSDSIGICAEGAYNRETMPEVQKRAIIELVKYLEKKYGISTVLRHKDVGDTDCPGKNFPFTEIKKAVKLTAIKVKHPFPLAEGHWYGPVSTNSKAHSGYYTTSDRSAIKKIQKVVGVSQTGKYNSNTKKAVVAYQTKKKLTADGLVGVKTWNKMFN